MATTALIAHIAAAKYAWQSTLYRKAQILAGQGVVVDRQTLARWMGSAAWMARGLYDLQLKTMHRFARFFATRRQCRCSIRDAAARRSAILGARDRRPRLEGSNAAGRRLRVRGRPWQRGDHDATGNPKHVPSITSPISPTHYDVELVLDHLATKRCLSPRGC
jgi:hypothetical protein